MTTLLILGSKADPALPCARPTTAGLRQRVRLLGRASRAAHARLYRDDRGADLGQGGGRHSLQALRGLETRTLHFLPRPCARAARQAGARPPQAVAPEAVLHEAAAQAGALSLRALRRAPSAYYHELMRALCDHDPAIDALIRPSSRRPGCSRWRRGHRLAQRQVHPSGFDFGLEPRLWREPADPRPAARPEQARRDRRRDHPPPRARHGAIVTTEPTVHARAGVPLCRRT